MWSRIIVFSNIVTWILYVINLMIAVLIEDEARIDFTVVIQCDIASTIAISIVCAIHLLDLILKLFLCDDKALLLDLNYSIYDAYREKRPEFTMENKHSVDMVIGYLFSIIRGTDVAITNKFDRERICGAYFQKKYQQMPCSLRVQIKWHAMGYMMVFSIGIVIIINMLLNLFTVLELNIIQILLSSCVCVHIHVDRGFERTLLR